MKIELFSPLQGLVIPIEEVGDPAFSQKLLGDGFAINPITNILRAPCDGEVKHIHDSGHAITIETANKLQVLMHVGINTVKLKGDGFAPVVKIGQKVSVGEPLIDFDLDFIAMKGLDLTTMTIVMSDVADIRLTLKDKVSVIDESSLVGAVAILDSFTENSDDSDLDNFDSIQYTVDLPVGMHARPAARIAKLVKESGSVVHFIKGSEQALASSIVDILGLNIQNGDIIQIRTGSTSEVILANIKDLLDQITIEERETQSVESHSVSNSKNPVRKDKDGAFYGVSASSGISIGTVSILSKESISFDEDSKDKVLEKKRLLEALDRAKDDLQKIEFDLSSDGDTSKSAIFNAHKEILEDSEILEECFVGINSWKTAEFVWSSIIDQKAKKLEALNNELIAARANDIRDVGRRVLLLLSGKTSEKPTLQENTIILAYDLTPSDILQFDQSKVVGFATVCGGSTSHVAILARSMGIPAIAGISDVALQIPNGTQVILDAEDGSLISAPSEEKIVIAKKMQAKFEAKLKEALESSMETTFTKDQHRIKVVSNISGLNDSKKTTEIGGEGVGLLRTEFLFLERKEAPSEDEQLKIYQGIVDNLCENELVLRTLDIGGDKQLAYLPIKEEENPFLGIRGIRFCLRNEGIFREQLRAVLRVKSKSPINIMFPMIGHLSELLKAKSILEEERIKLNAPKPHVGIMIEVPSAALMASTFAPHVDFFSVGTNDLTQYTLATDRGHSELAGQVDGLHPAVLKLIEVTCSAAKKYGKWVGVCGGIASDSKAIPVLIGLGVEELSVSIPSIPIVKSIVRKVEKSRCELLKDKFLDASNAREVREIVNREWPSL